MSIRVLTVGVAALVWAVPAAAQERGTVEFGGFASAASFENSLSLKTAVGGGGRVGMYLDPRWSIEFEDAEMRANRPNGLANVNVGILSGRLVATPVKTGALSLLVGAGAGVSTETNFLHSYGVDGLVGVKVALSNHAAFRVDAVWDWLANQHWQNYGSVRAGISVYRRPGQQTRTVTVTTPAPPPIVITHEDSVSAAETRRLRERDAALRALRDSLRDAPVRVVQEVTGEVVTVPAPSPMVVATMRAQIHFAFDKSDLTDSAKAILDEKIEVFRANPALTIVVLGFTDLIGTESYNLGLGTRRAKAAKAYIVGHGIDANRIIIESEGESRPLTEAPGVAGQAPNRRAVFQLLIAPEGIRKP